MVVWVKEAVWTPPSPSRTPNPKLNFRVRPYFWSSQILYPTSRRSRSSQHPCALDDALRYPWLTTATTTTIDAPFHVDLSPTDKTGVRAKWHSALTGIRAANMFSSFSATASRSSMQGNGRWRDHDSSPGVTSAPSKQQVEVKEGEAIPGSCEPVHSLDRGSRNEFRWFFDASSCKVDYIVIVIFHWDVLQTLTIVLGMSRANN